MIGQGCCARIARTFLSLNLNNNSLSKVVDTNDLISAWLLLRYVHQHLFTWQFFFLCFRCIHELPRSQGTLIQLNILHYARFVPCTFSFSSVGVQVQVVPFLVYEKKADKVCMFCFQILYLWLQYSIMYLQHLFLCFFNRRTDS